MANRYLTQKMISTIRSSLNSCESVILRRLSTAATARRWTDKRRLVDKRRLYSWLYVAGSNGEKMSDVLNQVTRQGKEFAKADLVSCVKDLRKHGRYLSCLEILEWMGENMDDYSDRDQALCLGIIYNLKGIDEAEKYFASLPPAAKTFPIYGSLLNCYCTEKSTDKALALFEEMDKLNFTNAVAFNNLMGLYMKVGQPEKVPPLVEEMKQKDFQLNTYSYSVLIQSYGCLNDLEGVERVANEVQLQRRTNGDWTIYSSLAAAYIRAGQSEKAEAAVKKLEGFLNNSYDPDRAAYHYLISLCASLGNLDYVNQVWGKLKSRFKVCNNESYLNMLYSLSKLDDIKGMRRCLKEWESGCQTYDVRLPTAVIDACLKRDMIEEVEQLLKDATERAGEQMWNSHVSVMKYYLRKKQIDWALRHIELAIDNKWKRIKEKINLFIDYFMKEKDVDGAEKFCQILKKAQVLDSGGYYMRLLQVYAAAGKKAPQMRWRMEKDGVDIGPEHEEFLKKICPDQNPI